MWPNILVTGNLLSINFPSCAFGADWAEVKPDQTVCGSAFVSLDSEGLTSSSESENRVRFSRKYSVPRIKATTTPAKMLTSRFRIVKSNESLSKRMRMGFLIRYADNLGACEGGSKYRGRSKVESQLLWVLVAFEDRGNQSLSRMEMYTAIS